MSAQSASNRRSVEIVSHDGNDARHGCHKVGIRAKMDMLTITLDSVQTETTVCGLESPTFFLTLVLRHRSCGSNPRPTLSAGQRDEEGADMQ